MTAPSEQLTDETIAQQCLAVRVRLLNRVITNIYDDAFRSLGVKTSQLNIMVAAMRLGLARPAEVCRILQLDASTLSRNVERMKAKGWLEVVADEDARAQPFRLTAKGRRLLEKAKPAWVEAQRKAAEVLGPDAIDTINDAVARIHAGDDHC